MPVRFPRVIRNPGVRRQTPAQKVPADGPAINPFTARGQGSHRPLAGPAAPAPAQETIGGLPYNPGVGAQIEGLGRTRDLTLQGIDGEQGAYLGHAGVTVDGQGAPSLDFSDPRSRAYQLQKNWENAKRGHYQGAGHSLYSGAYQQQLGIDARGEQTDYGNLLGEASQTLAGFNTRRLGAYGDYETGVGSAIGGYAAALAAQPGPDTPEQAPAPTAARATVRRKARVRQRR